MRIHKSLDFWTVDRGLTRMLVLLVVAIFLVGPVLRETSLAVLLFSILFAGILLSGVHATGITGYPRVAAYGTALASVLLQAVLFVRPGPYAALAESAANTLALALLDGVILYRVFSPGAINANRIKGAIAAYLVLGLIFATAYEFVDILHPGALQFNEESLGPERFKIIYFSFVSLTTMGYGDIVPVHAFARSLAIAEGLIGQLYPAILIGRLISMGNWERSE